jgi:hypothetical protein
MARTNIFAEQARSRITYGKRTASQLVGALFTTPDEVHNAKLALDPQVVATNRQWEAVGLGNASNNPQFSPAAAQDLFAWTSFFNTWNAFAIEDSSVLTASSDMDRLNDFTTQLGQWQKQLTADTGLKPTLPATPITNSGGAIGNVASTEGKAIASIATPLLELGALLLAGYLAVEFAPLIFARRA